MVYNILYVDFICLKEAIFFMRKIKIITDSTADLSKELLDRFDISFIPLYVTINQKSYKDIIDITPNELYKLVDEYGELPKSSAPSVQDFIEVFSKYIEEDYDIVYVSLSSKLSAAFQNATIASKEFGDERIFVIDSLNLSTGIGHLAIIAAELRDKGYTAKEIYNSVLQIVPKVRSSFIISTLKYLHMGGRCSSIQMLAGNILKINPQIIVKDGGMVVGNKYRGIGNKVLDLFYKDHVLSVKNSINRNRVFVTHSAYTDGAHYLKDCLIRDFDFKEVLITHASCVISTHCGPGTVGILYIEE